ncbi:MAG: hypothetical protein ABIR33_17975 [Pyrinomonadaceae bacterium]
MTSFRFDYRCTSDGTEPSLSLTKYSEYFKADDAFRVVDEVEKGLRALGKDMVVVRTQVSVQTFPATVLEARSLATLRKYIFVKLKRGQLGAVVWQTRQTGQSFEEFATKFASTSEKFADSLKILSDK